MGITSGDSLVIAQVTDEYLVLKKQPNYYDFLGIATPQEKDPVVRIRELRDNWR